MSEEQLPPEVEANIAQSIGEQEQRPKKREPVYKVVGDSKIPVSKAYGSVWKSRRDLAIKNVEDVSNSWQEAIRYFENDQSDHRVTNERGSGNVIGNTRLNNNITETENVVFANVTTMVPALYSRNPRAEFTSNTEAGKPMATMLERLVNVLGHRRASPGLNIKSKAKRCVVTTLLANRSWLKVGWNTKEESSEQALADLSKLAKQLEKAKKPQKIEEIEGHIEALETSIDILQPSGPFIKFRSPGNVLVDPNALEVDGSDAKWMMECDYISSEFIKARYATKKPGTEEYKSLYQPTHVMKVGSQISDSHGDDDFSLYTNENDYKAFGFDSDEAFEKAKLTKVWFIWDKITRRVLMYNDKDWTWPVWVWDDPLRLDSFFPYFPLWFFESPSGPNTKGEVSYYLDQQDAINEMVDEERRARLWARRNIFYNSNLVDREDVEAILNGPDGTARGLNLPAELRLEDAIGTITPPSIRFTELFDKEGKYRAIDRISSVGEVLRGAQFKTNTTNDAVQANVSAANMRVDEKTDAIEDWMGTIYWAIAQLCLQFMDKETVTALIGDEAAAEWQNFSPEEINRIFSMRVVGGSSKKPTSQAKKEEALELGQVLGQFANATPIVVKVALEALQEAFDEVVIAEEDWDKILEGIDQAMQQQQGEGGGGAPQEAASPQQGQQGQQGQLPPQSPAEGQIPNDPQQIQQLLDQLPPELKQQVAAAIQQGASPQQALQAALQQIQ